MNRSHFLLCCCVYAIVCPVTKGIVYIGTAHCAYDRFVQHVNNKSDNKLGTWIKSLNGLEPEFLYIEIFDKETDNYWDRYVRESYWISVFKNELGYNLLNTHS